MLSMIIFVAEVTQHNFTLETAVRFIFYVLMLLLIIRKRSKLKLQEKLKFKIYDNLVIHYVFLRSIYNTNYAQFNWNDSSTKNVYCVCT